MGGFGSDMAWAFFDCFCSLILESVWDSWIEIMSWIALDVIFFFSKILEF